MVAKKYTLILRCSRVIFVLCMVVFFSCSNDSAEKSSGAAEQQKVEENTTNTGDKKSPQIPENEDMFDTEEQLQIAKTAEKPGSRNTAPPQSGANEIVKSAAQEPQSKPSFKLSNVEMVPLKIDLPKPMFVGTPQNMRVPNLEKPLGKPRPPFLAPAGTENVASGRPVASTDEAPIIGEIEMITDGDKQAADGSYVELGPFVQHVTIDLGEKHEIYAVLFWHFHKQPRVYFDVVVQVADDPDFKTNVHTLFNNDHNNSAGFGVGSDMHYVETSEGKLVDAKGVHGRYVRLYSNGNNNNDLNHYIEAEVYGIPLSAM